MAYDRDSFGHTGGTSRAPRSHTYHTADSKATVVSDSYFGEEHVRLRVDDLITVVNSTDIYELFVLSVSKNVVTVGLTSLLQIGFVEYHIPVASLPAIVNLNDDGVTYSVVPNMNIDFGNQFTLVGGALQYNGAGGKFLFNGTSATESNKVGEAFYSLILNGTPIADEETPITFLSANKKRQMAITGILELATGDQLTFQPRSDGTAGVILTIHKLDITLSGVGV